MVVLNIVSCRHPHTKLEIVRPIDPKVWEFRCTNCGSVVESYQTMKVNGKDFRVL